MRKCQPDSEIAQTSQSIIWRDQDEVCIRLLRRKNRQHGSGVMRRKCTCTGSLDTCVVHTLWDRFFEHLPDGAVPWVNVSANNARCRLRRLLESLGVPDAAAYGTHDFRRGHAQVCISMRTSCWRLGFSSLSVYRTCYNVAPL